MIHFVCDACKRPLAAAEARYVVRMEVFAALSEVGTADDDRDHLTEIQDFLESTDDADDEPFDAAPAQQLRFDLCSECRKTFLADPLGRRIAQPFDFSKN
jgi:hypothetical protein